METILINNICTGIAICLTSEEDFINCPRIIFHFKENPRVRLNIDQKESCKLENLCKLIGKKVDTIIIYEDSIKFFYESTLPGVPIETECYVKVLEIICKA